MIARLPGPVCQFLKHLPIDVGTLARFCSPQPGHVEPPVTPVKSGRALSGEYWVDWANSFAQNSDDLDDLAEPFQSNVKAFISALEEAGAEVEVAATRRDAKRAYLFHWSWLIGLGKARPKVATHMAGVDIEWDHGKLARSRAGAKEMIEGFRLAVPPKSKVAPALASNHIAGKALDMHITWEGDLTVKKRNGETATVTFMKDPNANKKLHEVGASYGVIKHVNDAPHWSVNGR